MSSVSSKQGLRGLQLACGALLLGLVLIASPARAQSAACVYLQPGAGYAAWMQVVSGSFESAWSDLFSIGQYRCIALAPIADGAEFTVRISALLGSSKVPCTPSLRRNSAFTGNVTYNAWGTTLNVRCVMPGSVVDEVDESPQPTEEGLKAAAQVKALGDKLKPSPDEKGTRDEKTK